MRVPGAVQFDKRYCKIDISEISLNRSTSVKVAWESVKLRVYLFRVNYRTNCVGLQVQVVM